MTAELWARLKTIFNEAPEKPWPERKPIVAEACGGDLRLRRKLLDARRFSGPNVCRIHELFVTRENEGLVRWLGSGGMGDHMRHLIESCNKQLPSRGSVLRLLRWSSGLPFSLLEPGWTTDWQVRSFGVVTAPIKMHKHYDQNHNPQFFADPDAINNGVATGSPIRMPYPGEAGQRNNFRGDGYFDIDSGLAKTWKVREFGAIHFEREVYNVTNSVRFDVSPANIGQGLTGGNLGVSSATLTVPRRMQFALRYDF